MSYTEFPQEIPSDKETNQPELSKFTSAEKNTEEVPKSFLKKLYIAYFINIRQNENLKQNK